MPDEATRFTFGALAWNEYTGWRSLLAASALTDALGFDSLRT